MFTKEFRDRIIEKLEKDKKDLEFVGVGAARVVYGLNKDIVFKIDKTDTLDEHLIDEIKKELKEKNIFRVGPYNTFIEILGLENNDESIEIYLKNKDSIQSIQEVENWNSIKETILKDKVCEIYDIFTYKNLTIVVQERGEAFRSNQSSCACEAEPAGVKYNTDIKRSELSDKIDDVRDAFSKEGIFLSDAHSGNFVLAKNGKLKVCDFGWGTFEKRIINSDLFGERTSESSCYNDYAGFRYSKSDY